MSKYIKKKNIKIHCQFLYMLLPVEIIIILKHQKDAPKMTHLSSFLSLEILLEPAEGFDIPNEEFNKLVDTIIDDQQVKEVLTKKC